VEDTTALFSSLDVCTIVAGFDTVEDSDVDVAVCDIVGEFVLVEAALAAGTKAFDAALIA
jgi:hypothetical protein